MDGPAESSLSEEVTRLLERLSDGDEEAGGELLPLVYRELHGAAQRCMFDERTGHTLQPTALVNEAYLRLLDGSAPRQWEGRAHFLRLASRAMRNVLVDHARAKRAQKRGQGGRALPIDYVLAEFEERSLDVLEVHDALEKLTEVDEELARVVEVRFFGGLTIAEAASALGSSHATIERSWRVARAWMRRELGEDER